MLEGSLLDVSDRCPADSTVSVWPAWEVREGLEATSWFTVRLAFPDGARVDALAVVCAGCVCLEDVRAQPALPLDDLAVLADWIEGPLFEASGLDPEPSAARRDPPWPCGIEGRRRVAEEYRAAQEDGSQNDVSVSGDLLFLSTDSSRSDSSCNSATQPATEKSSWEGMKVFDISDKRNPRYVAAVETACGSHTHTLVPERRDVYVYVSSYSPSASYPDCRPPHDGISVIKVPRSHPEKAAVVNFPVLFPGDGPDGGGNPGSPTNPGVSKTTGCHDITVLPSRDLAAGACMGDGILFSIKDPEHPKVIDQVQDNVNFAFWHSATFNQRANKVVFTDELGGGGAATCNAAIGPNRGADGIYDIVGKGDNRKLVFRGYYKIPRHQADTENCVAHNGSLIPVKGRDIMVQAWYQGGVSVWDFTDSAKPREIGYFERGPLSTDAITTGGSWSAYYYNGYIYSNDIAKGFDVLKLTDRRTDPAKRVRLGELNVQSQPDYFG